MKRLLYLRPLIFLLFVTLVGPLARAHTATLTLVQVSFVRADSADIQVEADLTQLLGSSQRYYELATAPREQQQRQVASLLPMLADAVQLYVGQSRLQLELTGFVPATATQAEFLDRSISKHSTFRFSAALPPDRGPLRIVSPLGAAIDYPIAYTLRRIRRPRAGSSPGCTRVRRSSGHSGRRRGFDPDRLSWANQLATYLRLGFRHIVPEGTDHILFVLGLFFLGITWRKALSQTTVFTIAHATTLFLATYGIFRLPSQIVEPAIALSITWIAAENVIRPTLGPARLAIVFAFGLVHGLGFASSLSEVPFPKRDFLIALLGFNFGVDFGQLFVIGLALLSVGWFREAPWFRRRIAIPCSVAIAAVGLYWAVERIWSYARA